ncbi:MULTISPECIES: imidazolonepropionase-like domain-containing protein [unclassified Kitasatospora]|uniref:amidohydrolase family protein n=1 Tax=unclassified Kitasatospora TaxID=2633591 RepID=UPI0033DDDC3B
MLTLHRAAFVLPDPADPAAPSIADGAVVVRGEHVEAVGPYEDLVAAHPGARVRDWGSALLAPGLRNPYGHWLLERAYHPDPREEIGVEPVADGLVGSTDEVRCGASARRGLQRMLGFGVTAVAGPFERASVRTAVARSGLAGLPGSSGSSGVSSGAGAGPLDPLAVLPFAEAVYGRVAAGGRADFAVFAVSASVSVSAGVPTVVAAVVPAAGEGRAEPVAGGCLATVLGGRLVYRRR